MKRYKHTLSNYRVQSGNMGELIPLACVPVLPGDTFQHHTNALVRMAPLNTPVMHPVNVRIHHFFVPNRIVWDEWEEFITGGEDGMSTAEIPTIQTTAEKNTILHRLGIPNIAGVDVSALPVRAFNKIYNEYYRDQHLVTARDEDDITIPRCAWEKDYFTTSRPWTQLGPDVTLPLGDWAPVVADDVNNQMFTIGAPRSGAQEFNMLTDGDVGQNKLYLDNVNPGASGNKLGVNLSSAEAPSVNDFRAAFSLQRYQEARARYGSRFTEYLRYLGIRPSDSRLQRPEWCGGGSTRLSFSEVLQTAPTDATGGPEEATGIGDMFGHGIAGARTNRYRKFFEEHGFVISILSVRPKSIYLNGIPREWLKTAKEDYFQKELVNLGQQEVYQAELYAENSRDVFGFNDRYHEYRTHPSQVLGDMRDLLSSWHLGRDLESNVTLNEAFITCDPSRRIFQIEDETLDTLWIMANNHIVARRLVPKRANPRIL
jgi:hypothetical protein